MDKSHEETSSPAPATLLFRKTSVEPSENLCAYARSSLSTCQIFHTIPYTAPRTHLSWSVFFCSPSQCGNYAGSFQGMMVKTPRQIGAETQTNENHFGPSSGTSRPSLYSLRANVWWAVAVVFENSKARWYYIDDAAATLPSVFPDRARYGNVASGWTELVNDFKILHVGSRTQYDGA